MLTNEEVRLWSDRLRLSQEAQAVVAEIRASDPARRVGGGRRNVSGRYPSRKMGVTIQFESHRVELPFVYEMEHDPEVLEFYDQPPSIPLEDDNNGRHRTITHTPDYFVLRRQSAGWEECKSEGDLQKLAQKRPSRYCRGEDSRWRCPPGEAYAARLNLYYRLRSSAEIDGTLQRNIVFLEDYRRSEPPEIEPAIRQAVLVKVSAAPGLRLSELFQATDRLATPDHIHRLIATDALYVDLRAAALATPDQVRVFASPEIAAAYRCVDPDRDVTCPPRFVRFAVGNSIIWDGRPWRIVNVGERMVYLVGEDRTFTEMPLAGMEALVRNGQITALDSATPSESATARLLATASDADLRVATQRFQLVHQFLKGTLTVEESAVPARTLRDWIAKYKRAREQHGRGYLGLIPKTSQRGNRTCKLPEETRALLNHIIANDYESLKQKTRTSSYGALVQACEDKGIPSPSYVTFCREVKRRPALESTTKRKGRRAAYQHEPFYWELGSGTPRHGDRPFEIAHIDHTELDVVLVCSSTGHVLGRPWVTLMSDAFSRRVLAFDLSFDEPSYRSCMTVIRDCVRQHLRLPQILVVDGGPEFQSIYFESLLALYEVTKKTRPPAQPRFGSVCERLFGTTNTQFIHNLRGNTQIMRNVRQVTKSVNPKQQAAWTLGELHPRLCEYLFEMYDTNPHPALGQSPRESFRAGLEATGVRSERMIPYNQDFLMATLPTTPKGTAKVLPGRGVKINHLFYWSDRFKDPAVENQQVPVRYDPWDAGTAHAFVGGQWLTCQSEHYSVFRGHSEKELMVASQELRRRRQSYAQAFTITARKLADFIQSVEAEEPLLMQRRRDQEAQALRGAPPCLAESAESSPKADDEVVVELSTAMPEIYEEF